MVLPPCREYAGASNGYIGIDPWARGLKNGLPLLCDHNQLGGYRSLR